MLGVDYNPTAQELRSFPDVLEPALPKGNQVNHMPRVSRHLTLADYMKLATRQRATKWWARREFWTQRTPTRGATMHFVRFIAILRSAIRWFFSGRHSSATYHRTPFLSWATCEPAKNFIVGLSSWKRLQKMNLREGGSGPPRRATTSNDNSKRGHNLLLGTSLKQRYNYKRVKETRKNTLTTSTVSHTPPLHRRHHES